MPHDTGTRAVALLWRAALATSLVCAIGLLPWLARTDPALTVLKARSPDRDPAPEVLADIRTQLGLDAGPLRPLGQWLGGLPRGDAGRCWISGEPVTPAVLQALGVSLLLTAVALLVAVGTAALVCARTLWLGSRRRLGGDRAGGTPVARRPAPRRHPQSQLQQPQPSEQTAPARESDPSPDPEPASAGTERAG